MNKRISIVSSDLAVEQFAIRLACEMMKLEPLSFVPSRWDTGPSDWRCDILQADSGRGLHINYDRSNGRAEISGFYPRTRDGKTMTARNSVPRISVSTKRDIRAVARDVSRRFWTPYVAWYASELSRVESSDSFDQLTEDTARELAEQFGGTIAPHDQSRVYLGMPLHAISVAGSTVGFERLALPASLARKVIGLILRESSS